MSSSRPPATPTPPTGSSSATRSPFSARRRPTSWLTGSATRGWPRSRSASWAGSANRMISARRSSACSRPSIGASSPNPSSATSDWTLGSLGYAPRRSGRTAGSSTSSGRPVGRRGRPGRGYWVMRTSPWERPFVWSEAAAGRLRQGWASVDTQNLEVVADLIRRGAPLDDDQQATRRALRMLTSWEDGMQVDDLVVAPNLPDYGQVTVFRVSGSYRWEPAAPHRFGERFGHVLPVELVGQPIARSSPEISDGLRAILRVQTRLYNINGYGGDVELLIGGQASTDRWGELGPTPTTGSCSAGSRPTASARRSWTSRRSQPSSAGRPTRSAGSGVTAHRTCPAALCRRRARRSRLGSTRVEHWPGTTARVMSDGCRDRWQADWQ